ncbi:MAG: hypothetical protein KF906_03700 [Actinobacteria bacterium]|nr:hypothetical protein [Actinomycetota bacterium]
MVLLAAACSGDGDDPIGFATPREVVDAHIAASRAYDLAADCALRHPDVVAEMATLDGRDAEGYCEWATASAVADTPEDRKARTREIYTDPTVTAGSATDERATFSVEAADGSYHEEVTVVQVDGRWFLENVEGADVEDDHDH